MTARRSANLLLVDDDPGLLKLLGMRLSSEGFQVSTAESGPEALKVLNKEKIDLVISDLRMDEMDGMALFAEIQKTHSGMPVIILTAHGSIPDAVAATREGVFSFLTKPVDRDALYKAIDDALALSTTTVSDESWCEGVVTRSPLMLRLLEQARMVAQSDVSVLINGQSGTERGTGPGYPQSQSESEKTVYRHQLWCTAGAVAGIRAVRPCQRCLYRRGEQPGRAVPGGRERHTVPR